MYFSSQRFHRWIDRGLKYSFYISRYVDAWRSQNANLFIKQEANKWAKKKIKPQIFLS